MMRTFCRYLLWKLSLSYFISVYMLSMARMAVLHKVARMAMLHKVARMAELYKMARMAVLHKMARMARLHKMARMVVCVTSKRVGSLKKFSV